MTKSNSAYLSASSIVEALDAVKAALDVLGRVPYSSPDAAAAGVARIQLYSLKGTLTFLAERLGGIDIESDVQEKEAA